MIARQDAYAAKTDAKSSAFVGAEEEELPF
jgi:hypothetical protein